MLSRDFRHLRPFSKQGELLSRRLLTIRGDGDRHRRIKKIQTQALVFYQGVHHGSVRKRQAEGAATGSPPGVA